MTGTLERLLAPFDVTDFAADTFGRQKLLVAGERDGYPDILSLGDFEELLLTLTSPSDTAWLRLVRKGTTLPVVSHMLDPRGMLNTSVLFERFARGYSIVLNQVHRRSRSVRRACVGLERDLVEATGLRLASEVFANAYLSPAGHQAFQPHTDSEHVFVLQLSGRKRWGLWPQTEPAPVSSRERLRVDPEQPSESIVLAAGDLLYLPGGLPHAAHTLPGEHSLHLSIGVRPVTEAAVARAAIAGSDTLGKTLPADGGDIAVTLEPAAAQRLALAADRRTLVEGPAGAGVLERLVRPVAVGDRLELLANGREGLHDGPDGVLVLGRGCRRHLAGDQARAARELITEGTLEVGDVLSPQLATTLIACGVARRA